jgi:hypothetical protein
MNWIFFESIHFFRSFFESRGRGWCSVLQIVLYCSYMWRRLGSFVPGDLLYLGFLWTGISWRGLLSLSTGLNYDLCPLYQTPIIKKIKKPNMIWNGLQLYSLSDMVVLFYNKNGCISRSFRRVHSTQYKYRYHYLLFSYRVVCQIVKSVQCDLHLKESCIHF